MTVRAVLAVLAALALVAAAQPAVEHATRTRDAAALRASSGRLADAVDTLVRRSEPGQSVRTAPRRTLDVDVPAGGTLALETRPPRVVTKLPNAPSHRTSLPVPVRRCDDAPRSLRGPTTLVYLRTGERAVVLALRGFIRESGATPAHACPARTPPRGLGERV